MKATQFFISTLKEAPAEADVTSHKLMMRSGMIKRLVLGHLFLHADGPDRVIRKTEQIIREEMNRAGALELLMPHVVQPAELWQETGRWEKFGPSCCASGIATSATSSSNPRTEEPITDIAART
jgi:prolyl-tRNA synthetase